MPKFSVEYKIVSEADGLKNVSQFKKVVETDTSSIESLIPTMLLGPTLVDDLEYLVIRRIRAKPTKAVAK